MATIKSYTDLEQSDKLAEILSIETADGTWVRIAIADESLGVPEEYRHSEMPFKLYSGIGIPSWSLAALYDILPNNKDVSTTLSRGGWNIKASKYVDKWFVDYEDEDNPDYSFTLSANNQVDACVEMIIKLHELNLL